MLTDIRNGDAGDAGHSGKLRLTRYGLAFLGVSLKQAIHHDLCDRSDRPADIAFR
jgi:hypothetical protein